MSPRTTQPLPPDDYRASLTPRQRQMLDGLVARAFADVIIPWYERHPEALDELEAGEDEEEAAA